MPRYRAIYGATLPASAGLSFEAEDDSRAQTYAEEHAGEANWGGADYSTPQGCDIDVVRIERE